LSIKNFILKNFDLKLFFIILILLSYYRSPYIFDNGRFVSLDLTYHLLLKNFTFLESLTYVDYTARYINLISNISSIISSRFFDLSNAQYVSVYLSYIVCLIIFYSILFKNSYLFQTNYQKYFGALICLVAPVLSFEVWLNAINIQVYLGILCLITLFFRENKNNYFYIFLILIAGLSGIYACVLTPFFLLKYIYKKNFFDFLCFIILTICCLIQLFLIFYASNEIIPIGSQINPSSPSTSLTLIFTKFETISFSYNVMIRSFFGSTLPTYLLSIFDINLKNALEVNGIKNLLFIISILILIIFIFSICWFYNLIKDKNDKIIYSSLLIMFFLLSIIVIFGGDNDSINGRYASLPGVTLIFIFLHLTNCITYNLMKFFSFFLILSTMIFGLMDYRYQKYIFYLDCINCPNWSEEVKKYKLDNNYKMNAWPYHIDR